MAILLIAEHDGKQLKPVSYALINAVKDLNEQVSLLLVTAPNNGALIEQAKHIVGVDKILVASSDNYANIVAEDLAELIYSIADRFSFIAFAHSSIGKSTAPRVAAKLDVAQVSEIVKFIDKHSFVRPMYTSSVLAEVVSKQKVEVVTIRCSAFSVDFVHSAVSAEQETITPVFAKHKAKFVDLQQQISERPELTSAQVVVSGGKGFTSAQQFEQLIFPLAEKLNAAIGASRPIVDMGFVPNDWQVGQTGKVVAPKLYIAIGISGTIQHLAGMGQSKVIVAINNDPQAPIFTYADYGLVADLNQAIPELIEALK